MAVSFAVHCIGQERNIAECGRWPETGTTTFLGRFVITKADFIRFVAMNVPLGTVGVISINLVPYNRTRYL